MTFINETTHGVKQDCEMLLHTRLLDQKAAPVNHNQLVLGAVVLNFLALLLISGRLKQCL